jgi:hypothetical protein
MLNKGSGRQAKAVSPPPCLWALLLAMAMVLNSSWAWAAPCSDRPSLSALFLRPKKNFPLSPRVIDFIQGTRAH